MMNMTKKTLFTLSPLFALLLMFTASAFADTLTLTLSDPIQSGMPGSVVTFTATASAPAANSATLFLNADSFNVDSPLSVDDSGFFNNFPLSLDPGDSVTGELFAIDVPAGALGVYNGYFEILGGADDSASSVLGTVNFQVNTASQSVVPEPGSLVLSTTGMLFLSLLLLGSRKRSAIG